MDTQLFNTSVSIATAVVTSSTLAHGHPPYVVQTVVDLAFDVYETLKTRIAAVDAAEEAAARERAANKPLNKYAVELREAQRTASEGAQAAVSGLPGVKERERDV